MGTPAPGVGAGQQFSTEVQTGFGREPVAEQRFALEQQAAGPTASLPAAGAVESEVERILGVQQDFYAVLQVAPDEQPNSIRAKYFKLSRLVHPDKCRHQKASEASAAVNLAYETLQNPAKKKLYDSYIADKQKQTEEGTELTYAEWEAGKAIKLPRWLERLLQIPGCGYIIVIVFFPVWLVIALLLLVLAVLCLPLSLVRCCCCPMPEEASKEASEAAGAANPGAPLQTVIVEEPPQVVSTAAMPPTPIVLQEPPRSGVYSDGRQRQPVEAPQTVPQSSPGRRGLLDSWANLPQNKSPARPR